MDFITPPYLTQKTSVRRVMVTVLCALLPAIAVYYWLIGPIALVQIAIATVTALLVEGAVLAIRKKPIALFLGDGSAILTAWLIALAFPPMSPWWLIATGVTFGIVIAKHLYGGLGQNPFNPAMVAFAVCIVSFPAQMSHWPQPVSTTAFQQNINHILSRPVSDDAIDAMSGATPLDALKTGLKQANGTTSVKAIQENSTAFGHIGGHRWEFLALAYLAGGIFLCWKKIIDWQTPISFLAGIGGLAAILWLVFPESFASPLFHIATGGTMLAAFFIVTDPVSGATTPRGKMIFAAGCGLLAYLIRVFGGYPDGIAFAVLILNLCVPLIDLYTQPAIFGMKTRS